LRLTAGAPWYITNSVICKDLQIPTVKKKSAVSAPVTLLASVHTPMNLLPHLPNRQPTSACVDIGPTTCLPDSSLSL
jgi:hypothetical protein